MKLLSLLAATCLAACFSCAASAAGGGSEISRTKTEVVRATFATAADAQRAEMKIAPLYGGAPMCFTTRWDDSSWMHPPKAEMFKRIGLTPCFFLNHSDQFARRELPKIKALGGRFGNHSYSHPFLMESGVNRIFFEIVANKAWVESVSDMPCTTFAMPYNWWSPLDPKRAAKLAKILVDSGTFVSSNGPVPEGEQPPQEWLVGHNFNIGDDAPRVDQFWTNVERGLRANEKDGGLYPKLTLGTHSSRNAGVNEKQEEILRDAMKKHPEWWWTDDAHYGAYRYEFWHSKIVKTGVKGNVATFEVSRHDPAFLGAVQDLTYTFGDLKPLKVETSGGFDKATALPEKIDTVNAEGTSGEFPGVRLRVKVDEGKGLLAYAFEGGDVLEVLVNPAPMWEHARLMFADAKKKVELGKRNPAADYNEGDRLYCVGVDFLKDGKRGRVYSLVTVAGEKAATGETPRDCAMVLGPFETPNLDDAFWTPKSVPGVELQNLGDEINRYWRSMADPRRCGFSAAAYIGWEPGVKPEFKEALKRAKPGDHPRFLVALDFVCDADGEKDFLCNVGDRDEVVAYVNGEKLTFKGGKNRIKVKKGANRMLYRWVWTSGWSPQSALIAICDDQSVDRQVKFVPVKCQPRECVTAPQPYSFLKNFKGGWDRRKPVEFISQPDGSKVLKLGGSDDYGKRGSIDINNIGKALEAFRGYEVDFVVEYRLENAKLCPNQWAKDRTEDFKMVLWHWEHANAEYSSWVKPVAKFPEGGSTKGWVTERFHSCVQPDDDLSRAGVSLMATFGSGGSISFRDFRIEVSPRKVMDEAAAKVGARIPDGYKCPYSKKWLDGRKYRGTVCIWEFGPQDLEKICSWGCNLVRMSRFKPLTDDYGKLEERLAVLKKHKVRVVFAPMAPGGKGNRRKYAIFNDDRMRADFIRGWEKLATYFKGRDDVWAFGILNEPFQGYFGDPGDKYSYWGLVHDAIKAIRAIDPDRCIVATADAGGSPADYRPPFMLPYPFKDVWYELHFYSPLVLTHYGVLGKDIDPEKDRYPGLKVRKLHEWNKEMLGKVLDESKLFGDKYGAKFFVGEFSCHRTVPDAAQWLDDAADEIDRRFDLWAYHSYGEYDGWNLEYKEDKWGVKAKKCAPGEESARMKVMKKHWSKNAEAKGK